MQGEVSLPLSHLLRLVGAGRLVVATTVSPRRWAAWAAQVESADDRHAMQAAVVRGVSTPGASGRGSTAVTGSPQVIFLAVEGDGPRRRST